MKKILRILLWIGFALPAISCSEDQDNLPIDALEVQLTTVDEKGQESTVFEAGTNVSLVVKLVNQSTEEIEAGSYFDYCDIYTIEEFLLLYKWMKKSENEEEHYVPFGKAYVPPINCPAVNIPVVVPAHGEVIVAGSYWHNNPDNLPLTPGKYYSAFSYTLEFDGQSKKINLELEFEVQ